MRIIGISFFSLLIVFKALADESCLGSKELACKAAEDILVLHSCAQGGSVKECRDQVSIEKTLVAAGIAAGARANMRIHLSKLCKSVSLVTPFELLISVAIASPKTCPIDAQLLNNALKTHLDDIEKAVAKELATQKDFYEALKAQVLKPQASTTASRLQILDQLEADIGKNPREFLMDHKLFPGRDGPRGLSMSEALEIQKKKEAIQATRAVASRLQGAERERYLADTIYNILSKGKNQEGTPIEVAKRYLKPPTPPATFSQATANMREIQAGVEAVEKAATRLEKNRLLANLLQRFPDHPGLREFEAQARSLFRLEIEASNFRRQALPAKTAAFSSVDDVLRKAAQINMPEGFEGRLARETAERFDSFNQMLKKYLVKSMGASEADKVARGAVKRYGARSITTKALLATVTSVGFTAVSWGAEAMLYSEGIGCSTRPDGQHATYNSSCEPTPDIGPDTYQFLVSSSCDEIYTELKNYPKFCNALKSYKGFNGPERWQAKCTTSGFEMIDKLSDSPRGYYFETNSNGEITRGRVLQSKRDTSYLTNYAFLMNNENLTEIRRIKVGQQFKPNANDFTDPAIYESLNLADVEKSSEFPTSWGPGRDALVSLNLVNFTTSTVQNCCNDKTKSNSDTCGKYIAGYKMGSGSESSSQGSGSSIK